MNEWTLPEEEMEPIYNKCVEDNHINRFAIEVAQAAQKKLITYLDKEMKKESIGAPSEGYPLIGYRTISESKWQEIKEKVNGSD